jgi:hypothetical protein
MQNKSSLLHLQATECFVFIFNFGGRKCVDLGNEALLKKLISIKLHLIYLYKNQNYFICMAPGREEERERKDLLIIDHWMHRAEYSENTLQACY